MNSETLLKAVIFFFGLSKKDGSNCDLFYLVRDTVKDNILIGRQ